MKIPMVGELARLWRQISREIFLELKLERIEKVVFSFQTKLQPSLFILIRLAQSSFAISHFGPTKITKEENPSERNYFSFREFNFHVTYKVSVNSCAHLFNFHWPCFEYHCFFFFFFLFYFSSLLISLFSIFVDENEEEIFTTSISRNFCIAFTFCAISFLPFNILDWQISKLNVYRMLIRFTLIKFW